VITLSEPIRLSKLRKKYRFINDEIVPLLQQIQINMSRYAFTKEQHFGFEAAA
jgi:hypothetical protein